MNITEGVLSLMLVTSLVGLAGCGSGGDSDTGAGAGSPSPPSTSSSPQSSNSPSPGSAESAAITIKDFAYAGPDSVSPGAKATVTNDDSTAHTVTSDESGAFSVKVEHGKPATFTAPTKPGKYPYHCEYHANMHGTLVVK